MINGLDLFSGIGGISYALRDWVRPIAYCEIDTYCQGVLFSRMAANDLCMAPVWDDVATLEGEQFRGVVDIVYGGFPCQDISVAGTGKGLAGERSGLFFQIMRLVGEIQPTFVFLENVPAIRTRGLDTVLKEFTQAGYDCRWTMLSASDVGACHKRERWFLLAHSASLRCEERSSEALCQEWQTGQYEKFSDPELSDMESWGAFARSVGKNDELPFRVDRIRGLGNSVVPIQAKEAFKRLMGF